MRNNPGAYTTVGMNAAAVKVQTNRQTNASTGESHIWLTLVDELHGAGGEGYAAARISVNATDVTDLVNLARRIDRAVAELVLAEYPDPGLTVDAPAFEVPEALAEAAPGATFVPIGWADLAATPATSSPRPMPTGRPSSSTTPSGPRARCATGRTPTTWRPAGDRCPVRPRT